MPIQIHEPALSIHFFENNYYSLGMNFSEIEFTQCLVFFAVIRSPIKTCPK